MPPTTRSHKLKMQPKSNSAIASSSSSNHVISESVKTAKKRAHSKSIAETDASANNIVVQSKPKRMKLNTDSNGPMAPILLLPTEVLDRIFNTTDDFGLVNLADTCTRFESIALGVASKRYATQYIVING